MFTQDGTSSKSPDSKKLFYGGTLIILHLCGVLFSSRFDVLGAWFVDQARAPSKETLVVLATRQICHKFENKGEWADGYANWTSVSTGNGSTFLDFRGPLGGAQKPRITASRHFLLCGDSTMMRLFKNLPFNNPTNNTFVSLKTGNRCGMMEYFGLKRASKWLPPKLALEGPCVYGLQNPFCTDCSGCQSTLRVSYQDEKVDRTYEYVAMEFARDREYQTETSSTSQQTLGQYLGKTFQRDICIVGTGVHDVMLDITLEQYVVNVVEYVAILKAYCTKIIWLQISASLDKGPQQNKVLSQFNNGVERACDDLGGQVLIFNNWEMSLPSSLHADNVHHSSVYYQELGKLLFADSGY